MNSSSYPQNFGIKLEMDLYKRLNDLMLFDNILMEKDLIRLYGWDTSSIDHLLFYGNYIIPIQTKWVKTKRRETHAVNNFLKSVKIIQSVFNRPILFGIWCSRMTPFEDNQELMRKMNILSVSCFEDMEILIDKTIQVVMQLTKNV
jgi:hypothetical protein